MHCAVFQNKFELFEGLYNQIPVGEEAAGQMSTILWPIKLQTTTVHWVSVENFVLFLSRRQLNIIFNGREEQHFVAFCSLWNFCPQRGLLERHLLDMGRKYLGERAISCSQFRTSPPRPGLFVWLGRVLLFNPWRPTLVRLESAFPIFHPLKMPEKSLIWFAPPLWGQRVLGRECSTLVVTTWPGDVLALIGRCWITTPDHLSIVSFRRDKTHTFFKNDKQNTFNISYVCWFWLIGQDLIWLGNLEVWDLRNSTGASINIMILPLSWPN